MGSRRGAAPGRRARAGAPEAAGWEDEFQHLYRDAYERLADRIFSASEVARGKPAPDLFLHAARRMGTLVFSDMRALPGLLARPWPWCHPKVAGH